MQHWLNQSLRKWQQLQTDLNQSRNQEAQTALVLDGVAGDVDKLMTRQTELLQIIRTLSQTTPLAEELTGWESARAALIAEIGTLRAANVELQRRLNNRPGFATEEYE